VILLGADIATAIHPGRVAMYLTDGGHDISTEPDGALVTKTPVKDYQCANKNYVDKLPDYLTLTDEEKAKWVDMIGAVKKLEPLSTPSVIVQNSDGTMVAKRIAYDNYSPLGAVSILVPADSAKNEPAGVNVTGTPKGDWDCTPKKYVDNLPDNLTLTDEEKAKWTDMIGAIGKPTSSGVLYYSLTTGLSVLSMFTDDPSKYGIPRANVDGCISTNTPKNPKNCTNKQYVDDLIASLQAQIDELKGQ
jgi:hypothetical protein